MKEEKYIVVVEYMDGSTKEFIALSGDKLGIGLSYKGGKIISYRQLTKIN